MIQITFIDPSGVERSVSGIPELAAHVRDGSITAATLVRSAPSEPWRAAASEPDIAALLALKATGAVPTPVAPRRGRWWGWVLFGVSFILTITFGGMIGQTLMPGLGLNSGIALLVSISSAVFVWNWTGVPPWKWSRATLRSTRKPMFIFCGTGFALALVIVAAALFAAHQQPPRGLTDQELLDLAAKAHRAVPNN